MLVFVLIYKVEESGFHAIGKDNIQERDISVYRCVDSEIGRVSKLESKEGN